MAVIFCDSGTGNDADDGSTWALAKATLQAAVTAAGAGGTVYLADTHSESFGANYTLTCPAASNLPVTVISSDVLTGTSVSYTKAPAAQISTAGGTYDITIDGGGTFIGVFMEVGDDLFPVATGAEKIAFIDSILSFANQSRLGFSGIDGVYEFDGVEFKFNQTSSNSLPPIYGANTEQYVTFKSCSFTATTGAFSNFTGAIFALNDNTFFDLSGTDLSAFTGASSVISLDATAPNTVKIDGCKMPSGVAVFSTAAYTAVNGALATRCDANNYGILHDSYWGQLADADKTRTNGASDGTAFAWKVVTTANCSIGNPYATQWMPVWVPSTGSKTFTVYIGNATADLTDTECWLEVEYLGTASSTLPSYATNRNADILAAGTAHTDDTTSSWTGGLTYMQSLAETVTVNKAGLCQVRVVFIKPSATVYIDPLVTVS